MTKYIVVAGGVISGVGKGVATASIGRVMQSYGFSVTALKIDPYINCDAGTMRPTEHGEVWVTDDGVETDQDLGTYERFLGISLPGNHNVTTGQIFKTVIDKERMGGYLGETVQLIPHITNEIKKRILEAGEDKDIVLIEIGGTLGDFENTPFLFAIKSMETELEKENFCYVLVTYLPIPNHIDEMKTKPTQLSVKLLRENGIQPDIILCRGKQSLDEPRKKKIAQYSNLNPDHIISMPNVTGDGTPNTLYVIPLDFEKERLGEHILRTLHLQPKHPLDLSEWKKKVESIRTADQTVNIAMIGKYLDIGNFKLADSYVSVNESLKHACAKHHVQLNLTWIDSKTLEQGTQEDVEKHLTPFDGVIVPGGFGSVGVEGKINAIRYCREHNIPYLGLCYGLQLAVVEFARNVCALDAHTTEIAPGTKHPVVDILPEQKHVLQKGGTMRLGAWKSVLKDGTLVRKLYGASEIEERHRHRYEVNPKYHELLQKHGMVFSGMSPDGVLVENIELPDHLFFVGTQAHPEFKSSLLKPAPLFDGFIDACIKKH